jgi:hypothetical protein
LPEAPPCSDLRIDLFKFLRLTDGGASPKMKNMLGTVEARVYCPHSHGVGMVPELIFWVSPESINTASLNFTRRKICQ